MSETQPVIEPLLLRAAALGTAAGTIAFLFIGDGWRLSNIFLIPDLIVSLVLAASALLPRARLLPPLLCGFAMGAGVFATASADYLVQGRIGVGAGIALLTCLVSAGFILRHLMQTARR